MQDLLLDCCANVTRVARTLQAVGVGAMNQASVMTGTLCLTALCVSLVLAGFPFVLFGLVGLFF